MRRTRQSVTALLITVSLFASCGPCTPPNDTGTAGGTGTEGGAQPNANAAAATTAQDPLARADALLEAREFDQVVQLFSGVAPEAQLEPAVATRLVKALWGLEQVPKAERLCRDTLARHPAATAVSQHLAQIYMSLGQYAKAVDVLRAARAQGAPDAEIALALGVCLGRMEDLDGARAEFERAAQAGADRLDVDYNMAVLLNQYGKHDEAEELLRTAVREAEQNGDARRELARVLLCTGVDDAKRLEEAVLHLNAVLDANPEDWRANELMGDAYMAYGDPEAAVFYYTDALKYGRNPLHVEDKYRRAAQARNDLLREQGVLEEDKGDVPPKDTRPPIPDSVQQRWDKARRARAAEEAAAAGSKAEQADEKPEDGASGG